MAPKPANQKDLGRSAAAGPTLANLPEWALGRSGLHSPDRMLRTLGRSILALAEAGNEAAFLRKVCEIIAADCGCALVWVGFKTDDPERSVHPVSWAGIGQDYVADLQVTWAERERGLGPSGTAVRMAVPVVCPDIARDPNMAPWREQALSRGFASSASLPLVDGGVAFGTLTLYGNQTHAFTEDRLRILRELVDGLSGGILALRGREAERRVQEEHLRRLYARNAGVAHDLRNLIHMIGAQAELGQFMLNTAGSMRDCLDSIQRAAVKGAALAGQFVADGREKASPPKAVDLHQLLSGLEPLLQRMVGGQIRLVLDLDSGPGWVQADPDGLERVFLNLGLNARDAMPEGGTLTVQAWSLGDEVVASVRDSGCGMAPGTLDRVFEPFFTTKGPGKGTGLGLCTVKEIVGQCRGTVAIQSVLGQGTVVLIKLPRAPHPPSFISLGACP